MSSSTDASLDRLKNSSEDCQVLAETVLIKFDELRDRHLKKWFCEIKVPDAQIRDLQRIHKIVARHRAGDKRHNQSEEKSLKQFAQWTVDQNCMLTGQALKKVDWGEL
jgi:hypothetical protein